MCLCRLVLAIGFTHTHTHTYTHTHTHTHTRDENRSCWRNDRKRRREDLQKRGDKHQWRRLERCRYHTSCIIHNTHTHTHTHTSTHALYACYDACEASCLYLHFVLHMCVARTYLTHSLTHTHTHTHTLSHTHSYTHTQTQEKYRREAEARRKREDLVRRRIALEQKEREKRIQKAREEKKLIDTAVAENVCTFKYTGMPVCVYVCVYVCVCVCVCVCVPVCVLYMCCWRECICVGLL